MRQYNYLKSNDVATVESLTAWWSREMEERERLHGWNTYFVTFTFNQIPGIPAVRLKVMQDSVCRFYSNLLKRMIRKPRSIYQLFNRPRMLTAPDYPVFKHEKISVAAAAVNDGLHMHSILGVPLKSRLKVDVVSHVQQKPYTYVKAPIRRIHFEPRGGPES